MVLPKLVRRVGYHPETGYPETGPPSAGGAAVVQEFVCMLGCRNPLLVHRERLSVAEAARVCFNGLVESHPIKRNNVVALGAASPALITAAGELRPDVAHKRAQERQNEGSHTRRGGGTKHHPATARIGRVGACGQGIGGEGPAARASAWLHSAAESQSGWLVKGPAGEHDGAARAGVARRAGATARRDGRRRAGAVSDGRRPTSRRGPRVATKQRLISSASQIQSRASRRRRRKKSTHGLCYNDDQ